ncbi:MAG: hypothetical protein ACK2T7_13140 [Anaerolineales bacterium]
MSETMSINPGILELAKEIFGTLAEQRPEQSLSFVLSDDGEEAVSDAVKIVEWGIGGNKSKLKATALEVLEEMDQVPAGAPININLTEYELKAMEEVVAAVEKAIDNHQDGVLE